MADLKISQLTGASTPLAGTEVLPIVQSGSTVKVSVANLTAGRAVSAASVTASTGNFVVGTSGQGIDFSVAPSAPGMTGKLLNDYEEGTWTPGINYSVSIGDAVATIAVGSYTKVGRSVMLQGMLRWGESTASGNLTITGLPFTSSNVTNRRYANGIEAASLTGTVGGITIFLNSNSNVLSVNQSGTGSLSPVTDANTGAVQTLYFTLTYFV